MARNAMTESATGLMRKGAPWRKGIPWWLIAIEGLVIIGIGAYMIWESDSADHVARQLVAAILLVSAASNVLEAWRAPSSSSAVLQATRGGIGLAVGTIVVLANWSDYLANEAERLILGIGLIAYAAFGIAAIAYAFKAKESQANAGPITAALTLAYGIILLTGGQETSESRIQWLGGIAIVIGVALIIFALWQRSGSDEPA